MGICCKDYFEVKSTNDRVLHFELKDFWSDFVVAQIEEDIFKLWIDTIANFEGRKFVAISDMTNFKMTRDKGKALIARMMKHAQSYNLHHSVEIISQAITRITVTEPVEKVGHREYRSVVHTLDAALETVKEKLKELE